MYKIDFFISNNWIWSTLPLTMKGTLRELLARRLDAPGLTFLSLRLVRALAYWRFESYFSVDPDIIPWLLCFKYLRSLSPMSEAGISSPICGGDVRD